jgi:hypothetical protein
MHIRDVDVGEASQPPTQANPRDVQLREVGLPADFNQVVRDVSSDLIPHLVVGFLDFALRAGVLVFDLEGVQDVLPDVQKGVGVAEGEDGEFGVDAQDAFDVEDGLLDYVGVQGAVGVVADFAGPEGEVVVVADYQGVGEGHLVGVWEGQGEGG